MLLKLSTDELSLSYKVVRPKNKLTSFFRGSRKMRFNLDIEGFLFGPHSATFNLSRKKIIK